MRLLIFGSSARRGATGWTDNARVRALLTVVHPDVVIHGASPAGGADALADQEAVAARIATDPCPVDTKVDGPWPAAGMRRNARMFREKLPTLAAGFVTGPLGTPMSSGSARMAEICRDGILPYAPAIPIVIYRENGVSPLTPRFERGPGARAALDQIIALYLLSRAPALVPVGHAVRALVAGNAAPDAVITAVQCAAEEAPRWAPWLSAIEATVRAQMTIAAADPPPARRPSR